MSLIDTHSHIYYDQYKQDLSEVLDRAAEFNVEKIICVAVDIKSAEECLKLTQIYPNIYMSAGIHPHESKEAPLDYQKQLEPFLSYPKTEAVGEIGLDNIKHTELISEKRIENELEIKFNKKNL